MENGKNQITARYDERLLKLKNIKKDEFETDVEFKNRIARGEEKIKNEKESELAALKKRIENEYNQQITPFKENYKKLSEKEFVISYEKLVLELGTYDAVSDAFPVSIKVKQPIKGILVAANANIPIPREEAREFKQHFTNNMLRPEIKGNVYSQVKFAITRAYIIDDATTKRYSLFSPVIDIGNSTLYDTKAKLIWSKEGSENDVTWYAAQNYIKRLNEQAYMGFRDWRMPTREELRTLVSYAKSAGYGSEGKTIADFLNKEGFSNMQVKWYWTSTLEDSSDAWDILFKDGREAPHSLGLLNRVLPVRSGR